MYRTIATTIAALTAAGAFATASAPSAHALAEVSSGPEGLRIVDVTNLEDNWSLTLVQEDAETRYRFSSGGGFDGIRVGGGCAAAETRGDTVTAVTCVRLTPAVTVGLSGGNDDFAVPADFPDPLTASGGLGRDSITGGAANDTLTGGSDHDRLRGGGGDDVLTDGAGDDTLLGEAGDDTLRDGSGFNVLDGGEGADSLSTDGSVLGFSTLIGGPGSDVITGSQNNERIDARDGEPDTIVACGDHRRRGGDRDLAIIDLVDAEPPADCEAIDRSNRKEGPNVRVRTGRLAVTPTGVARVRLACPKANACAGTLTLRSSAAGPALARTSFRLRAGAARTVTLRLTRAERRQVLRAGRARLVAIERGRFGRKTTLRVVAATGR